MTDVRVQIEHACQLFPHLRDGNWGELCVAGDGYEHVIGDLVRQEAKPGTKAIPSVDECRPVLRGLLDDIANYAGELHK